MTEKWDPQPGDEVVVWNGWEATRLEVVDRLTRTQIVLYGSGAPRFRRSDHRRIGAFDPRARIIPPTDPRAAGFVREHGRHQAGNRLISATAGWLRTPQARAALRTAIASVAEYLDAEP